MLHKYLLPNKCKRIGWVFLVFAGITGILLTTEILSFEMQANVFAFIDEEFLGKTKTFEVIQTDITPTIIGILFLVGALLVSFSREKREDEFIANLRQSSLLWAVLINYILLIICFAVVYGTSFFNVMLYNMFTVLLLFIIRFNYILFRTAKQMPDEKHN
jgi:small-conductance mechanosensitive channel